MKPAVNLVGSWRSRLKTHLFWLHHENPKVFVQCQWQSGNEVSLPYLAYRVLLAVTFLGILVSSMCEIPKKETKNADFISKYEVTTTVSEPIFLLEKNKTEAPIIDTGLSYLVKWPIYLTNWGITACATQALLAAVILIQKKFSERNGSSRMSKMPLSYKFYWALHTTACVIAPAITILYWGLVYKSEGGPPSAVGILVHAINSILMMLDLALVSHPYQLHHFYFPSLMALMYAIFSVIYFLAGGTDRHQSTKIYPQLDWNKPWTLALPTLIGAFILMLIIHSSLYGLTLLRSYFGRRFMHPQSHHIGEGVDNKGASIDEHAFDVIESNGSSVPKDSISSVINMNNI